MSVLQRLALNDEGFVFDPATGDSFILNDSAAALIRGLQEGLDELQLVDRLSERFLVEPEQATSDVEDFLVQLRAMRLL